MLKKLFKRQMALFVVVGLLLSCINSGSYASEASGQYETKEQKAAAVEILLEKYHINISVLEGIDLSEGILYDLDPEMFPSFEEYLFQLERMLKVEGYGLIERIRFEAKMKKQAEQKSTTVSQKETLEEQVVTDESRYIIKYKTSASEQKVKGRLGNKIASTKKIDKQTAVNERQAVSGKSKGLTGEEKVTSEKSERVEVIKLKNDTSIEHLYSTLGSDILENDIEYIQPDYAITLSATAGDITDQWGLLNTAQTGNSIPIDVNVSSAWALSEGEGVTVAVIDSGMDTSHQGLADSLWINEGEIAGNGIDDDGNGFIDDICGWNFISDTDEVYDSSNSDDALHGTHVAGIIAAQKVNGEGTIGVAPLAKVMALKAFENGAAYTSDVIEAIRYAELMGAQIVNCSWGMGQNNQALKDAMAVSSMLFVSAAGNNGTNNDASPVYPASFNLPNVISVAAISGDGSLAAFSNYGMQSVHVSAPGQGIISTIPNGLYGAQSGTSMSAAFVSGQAALVLSRFSDLMAKQISNQIIYSSDRLSTLEGKVLEGNKVNCEASLLSIVPAVDTRIIYEITQSPESNGDDMLTIFASSSIKQVAAGEDYSLMLMKDGTVYAWGDNAYGQLGDGTTVDRHSPVLIRMPNLSIGDKVRTISVHGCNNMALTELGKVYTWGLEHLCPTQIESDKVFSSISAGGHHYMAITADGELYTWGDNTYGQLGYNTNTYKSSPALINIDGQVITNIAAGGMISMAVTESGQLYTWGQYSAGISQNVPQLVQTLNNVSIKDISAGRLHFMAVTESGQLYTWGSNTNGQLGDGTVVGKPDPVQISVGDTGEKVVSVSADIFRSVAMTNKGNLYAWGDNIYFDTEMGEIASQTTPVQIVIPGEKAASTSASFYHTMVVTESGKLYTWGKNNDGCLGTGGVINRYRPIQSYIPNLANGEKLNILLSNGAASMALTGAGRLYAWGANRSEAYINADITISGMPTPVSIGEDKTVKSAALGVYHSVAVTNAGELYVWGNNYFNQLGQSGMLSSDQPIRLNIAGEEFAAVSAGGYHSLAVTTDGKLYQWGDDLPITEMEIYENGIKRKIISVSAGNNHNMAITEDHSLYTWGYNSSGQIGDGSTTYRPTPVKIMDGTTFKAVSAGFSHSMALTEGGALYAWGNNASGQLGTGNTTNRLSPVRIMNWISFKDMAAGYTHSIAVTANNRLYAWGNNAQGQLGNGTTTGSTSPVLTMTDKNFASVSVGSGHSMALTEEGELYTWGSNSNGQLGDGIRILEMTTPVLVQIPKTVSFNPLAGTTVDFALTASGVAKPYRYMYYINYDTGKYAVDDLCTSTSAKETGAGEIPQANIIIAEHDPVAGVIVIMVTNSAAGFNGIINNIRFTKLSEGKGAITVTSYCSR